MKLVTQIFCLITVLLMIPSRVGVFDNMRISLMLLVVTVAIGVEWWSERKTKNIFRLDILFITGFVIVHFQWPLMFLFDVNLRSLHVEELIEYINYGTWLSAIGLISWLIGWGCMKHNVLPVKILTGLKYGKIKCLFAGLFILFLMVAGRDYLTGAIYRGDSDSASSEGIGAYVQLLLSCSAIGLIGCFVTDVAIKSRKKDWNWLKIDKLLALGLGGYVLMFLAVGDRGGAVQAMSALLLLFAVLIKPIDKKLFVVMALTGAFVLTIVGLGRDSGRKTETRSMIKDGLQEFQDLEMKSPYILTVELANSSICLYSSVAEINTREAYFYGSLWRSDLMAQVPFIKHIYARFFGWDDKKMSSSNYITYITYGEGSVSGTGSSIIADVYLNWGAIGVMVWMFGLGALYKRVYIGASRGESLIWIIVAAGLGSAAFYSARATFWVFLRPALWSSVMVYYLVKPKYEARKSHDKLE